AGPSARRVAPAYVAERFQLGERVFVDCTLPWARRRRVGGPVKRDVVGARRCRTFDSRQRIAVNIPSGRQAKQREKRGAHLPNAAARVMGGPCRNTWSPEHEHE